MTRQGAKTAQRVVLGLLALGVAAFMVWAAFWGDFVVERDQAQVQDIINRQLDRFASQSEEERKGALKNIRIKSVDVVIRDAIEITAHVEGSRFAQSFSTAVFAIGTPLYNPSERAFFFKTSEFKVVEFAYKGGTVAERAKGFVNRITRNEEANNLATELAPKLESWVTALAESAVKHGLERFPVYRLKDDAKGWVVSASLKSVEVKDGKIVAVVSVWKLTWKVLLFAAIFIGLLAALFAAPEVLLFGALLGSFS